MESNITLQLHHMAQAREKCRTKEKSILIISRFDNDKITVKLQVKTQLN